VIPTDTPKARLLAVDDNSDSAELIVRVASKCGYEARPMTDLRPLRSVLEEWKPHVLTLDLVMPQEDGIAILSTLKDSKFAGTLIIISGQDDWLRETAGRLASACGLNVAHHLSKPIDLKDLRSVLTTLQAAAADDAPRQRTAQA
jgi:two-component system chemotaxis response regulator CheY